MTTPDDPLQHARAHDWIAERLAEHGLGAAGAPRTIHEQPWSTVLEVPTTGGPMFFKAVATSLRHEVAVHAVLAARRPDVVPPPLASDPARGWMLLPDGGERLRDIVARTRALDGWLAALPVYASLQVAAVDDVDALLAAGAPDLRPAVLPAAFERLLVDLDRRAGPAEQALLERCTAAVPRVRELAEEVAASGLPDTVQHDDLNDGQVYRGPDGWRVLDWGDACVSHPFLSLSVALEGVIAWGVDDVADSVGTAPFRDAYLAPFAGYGPPDRLAAVVPAALRLGWVCRAVNARLSGLEEPGRTWTRLRMFLDGHP